MDGALEKSEWEVYTGKLWVRERIEAFVNKDSFVEIGSIASNTKYKGDGTIISYTPARVEKLAKRDAIVVVDDFTIRGGHADSAVWGKAVRLIDGSSGEGSITLLLEKGATNLPPLYGMHDMIASLSEIPVVAAALGPTVGLGAARATLTHFSIISADIGSLFAVGHPIVANVAFEIVSKKKKKNLVVFFCMPSNTNELLTRSITEGSLDRCDDDLLSIIPKRRQRMYQVRDIIIRVVDKGSWFEIGTVISASSCHKFRRHMDLCNTFGIPIINLADHAEFAVGATLTAGATFVDNRIPNMRAVWPSGNWRSIPLECGIYAAYRRELDAAEEKRNELYEK
ncbi:uncharacterized protein BX663DRAFT_559372 [Cokeromyces recurvatus]|uniref:uncharacterized protein n=1 Tax=Cokeromyces recurvatus TaxID=90255 RepID=UPI0022204AF7|nr:uncharacterized protein BX663DRAFT_559372 [Cokeromyces recurvatus]KAI7905163.1 hypothetical protein BX663DRAFT_559372 [Cokeromyces recurvatus]